MTRFDRKKRGWENLKIKSSGGIEDLIDNAFKELFFINDDEYDFFCENVSDEEMEKTIFTLGTNPSFSDKKKACEIINKYCMLLHQNNAIFKTTK